MKFRHKLYPSPIVHTVDAGSAQFADYTFETTDKALIAALKKDRFVEAIKPPAKPSRSRA